MAETKNETTVAKALDSLTNKDNKTEKNSALFYILTILTALILVVLIIGGAFFLALKNNVNGIADSMGDTFAKIPVLNLALPKKPDPTDEKSMTEEQVRTKYTEIKNERDQLEQQLAQANAKLDEINKQAAAKETDTALLQQQKTALEAEKAKLNSENAALQKKIDDISEALAKGDTASYKSYFESISPDVATTLYEQILNEEKISADVKKYVSIYETMDPSSVASILEQMGTSKMTLIIDIMKNMKKDTNAEILAAMTPSFAAGVSEQLAKVYNVGTATSTK